MTLDCLLDRCPKTGRTVDMRTCCGIQNPADACAYYGAAWWSECGEVTCTHPDAHHATPAEREMNRDVFRALAGVGHLLYAGEPRG
jgi:hypothetical protein